MVRILLTVLTLVVANAPLASQPPLSRGGWRVPTDADRANPPLVPWQRSLEDALRLVERTGKPLLLCVNKDGETACEELAWIRYRDPEFARRLAGFVCLVGSPDLREPADVDSRGRRLEDRRFGRVTNGEARLLEVQLFERWFGDQRVAPRHRAIDREGKVLFDVYLTQGFDELIAALERHGKPDGTTVDPTTLDERTLWDDPDAARRSELERRFLAADVDDRMRFASLALSNRRTVQHHDVLRMAFLDPDERVRMAAVRGVAAAIEVARIDEIAQAIDLAREDPATTRTLLAALEHPSRGADTDVAETARFVARLAAGFHLTSDLLDVEAWRAVLRDAARTEPSRDDLADLEDVERRLERLEDELDECGDDLDSLRRYAAVLHHRARLALLAGADPTFFLADVLATCERILEHGLADPIAHGWAAWAAYLRDEPERAADHARRALVSASDGAGLRAAPATRLTLEVLDLAAQLGARELYAAMEAEREWPATWIPDLLALHAVLAAHPDAGAHHVLAHADLLLALQAWRRELAVVRAGLQRFPLDPALHERARSVVLATDGEDALRALYESLLANASEADHATLAWYAALADLHRAEFLVRERRPDLARATYTRCSERFRAVLEREPRFEDASLHVVCLAEAGLARLDLDDGDLDAARAALLRALETRPATAESPDGLGLTPADTARLVFRALQRAGRREEALALRQRVEELGVEWGRGGR